MPAPLSDSALEAKRGRILEAARRVCRRSDLDAAKMADIAAEAKVSKGTLYRFFQSKEDLLIEMLRQALTEVDEAIERAVQAVNGAPGVDAYIELIAETVPSAMELNRLAFQALGLASRDEETGKQLFAFYWESWNRRGGQLRAAIESGQREGVFRPDVDPGMASIALLAITDGLQWRCHLDEKIRAPDRMRATFREMVRGWTLSS